MDRQDDLHAFAVEHVAKLTGLSARQLGYWSQTGFFAPRKLGAGHSPYSRIYSFRDVVGLRALGILRRKYRVPLQELRKAGRVLASIEKEPWSTLRLWVLGRTVVFNDPRTGVLTSTHPLGQTVHEVALEPIVVDARAAVVRLTQRSPQQLGQIKRNRYVVHNEPVLDGTRIPTAAIWTLSEAGYTEAQIIREYPRLTSADVRAALVFERSRRKKRAG